MCEQIFCHLSCAEDVSDAHGEDQKPGVGVKISVQNQVGVPESPKRVVARVNDQGGWQVEKAG